MDRYVTNPPAGYEVPGEYLDDETFAAMLSEAEKYLGYPYVWGGSSPATSFDCSGFVSWVINHSGWNVGRLGAQGLYNICTRTSSPRPGDLVFFKGTYDTPGVSHVGIYVGDGMMIHCGDPISYANLNTSYWQSHFYAYETAMRWTKGKYQFFVCTHTDKGHIHNHIYYNSTAFDRSRKFHNFIGSSFALRRLSDRVCIEHELSYIQNPKLHSKGRFLHYGQWIGEKPHPLPSRGCGWLSSRPWRKSPPTLRRSCGSWRSPALPSSMGGAA